MIDKILHISELYDLYGAILSDKQQTCLELHYFQDLSLAEIAENLEVSRQAVHDLLKRSEQILEDYESRLGLVKRRQEERQTLETVVSLLVQAEKSGHMPSIRAARQKVEVLIERVVRNE